MPDNSAMTPDLTATPERSERPPDGSFEPHSAAGPIKWLCLLLCAALWGLAAVVITMCGNFAEAFESLYTDLPALTRALLGGRYVWLLAPLLGSGLAVQMLRHVRHGPIPRRILITLVVLVVASVLFAAGTVAVLYVPIFRMSHML